MGPHVKDATGRKRPKSRAIMQPSSLRVLAAVVAYRLNATKEHVFFMRQKAEALYLSIERYDRSLGSYFVPDYGVLKNEISVSVATAAQASDIDGGASL